VKEKSEARAYTYSSRLFPIVLTSLALDLSLSYLYLDHVTSHIKVLLILLCTLFKWWQLEAFQAYGNACFHKVLSVNLNPKHMSDW